MDEQMNCQRCLENEAGYRVYSDILNLKVCASCAEKAQEFEIGVERLPEVKIDRRPDDAIST